MLRRSLLLVGFLLGCALVALASAGSAHADEDDRSSPSSEIRGGSDSGKGLLGGLLEPVVSPVAGVTDPVLSGVSQVVAPVVEPVVEAVEPVTVPLLTPVTEPLSPVLEVLAPVTGPLLGSAEPVVTPVAQGLGLDPEALGVDPSRTAPVQTAPVVDRPDAVVIVPPETSSPVEPSTTGVPVAVEVIGPLWATLIESPATFGTSDATADSRWHGQPGRGPVGPGQDPAVLAGATGTASSGGNAGGSPSQAELPGHHGLGMRDSGRVVPAQRWLMRPWCYVFGRHHPS
ncbi:hypothetical protein [Lentzea xinjiangensis]|nr:hypothetical protein [Lentzea xinjiangensis]